MEKIKMQMSREKMIQYYLTLRSLQRVHRTKFAYSIARNMKAVQAEVEATDAAKRPSDKYFEYDRKRLDLVKKYGLRTPKGELVVDENGSAQLWDSGSFAKEWEELKAQYAKVVEEQDNKAKELRDFLSEEVSWEAYPVKAEHCPNDLASEEVFWLLDILDGDLDSLPDPPEEKQ